MQEGDMIVSLYHLPKIKENEEIKIKRAFVTDKRKILEFIDDNFGGGWVCEAEHAMMQEPVKCFIAVKDKEVVGFSCFDSSAKGFFGPIGVSKSVRGQGVGEALLLTTLNSMREYGYAYGIIGWVGDAADFYRKTIGAEFIKGGTPDNSVYSNMIDR